MKYFKIPLFAVLGTFTGLFIVQELGDLYYTKLKKED